MLQRLVQRRKIYPLILALLLGVVPVLLLLNGSGYAADLNNRKVHIANSQPGVITSHVYNFDLGSSAVLGSIVFEYCSNSPLYTDPCVAPAGVDVTTATNPPAQSGATGFTVHGSTTVSKMILTRVPLFISARPVSYTLANITNPTTPKEITYVRISTYASVDGTGPATDRGSVVFVTSGDVGVFSFVPPMLVTCTGVTVGPKCTNVNGNFIDLGELSSASPKAATSQFAAATNDNAGYVTFITGSTMTSGNNVIPALAAPQASSAGTSQFGINLRSNSNPSVGQDPNGTGSGVPSATYNLPNQFVYNDGDTLITSGLSTDYNIFTISYLVNVQKAQPVGQYNTTLTLTTVVQF